MVAYERHPALMRCCSVSTSLTTARSTSNQFATRCRWLAPRRPRRRCATGSSALAVAAIRSGRDQAATSKLGAVAFDLSARHAASNRASSCCIDHAWSNRSTVEPVTGHGRCERRPSGGPSGVPSGGSAAAEAASQAAAQAASRAASRAASQRRFCSGGRKRRSERPGAAARVAAGWRPKWRPKWRPEWRPPERRPKRRPERRPERRSQRRPQWRSLQRRLERRPQRRPKRRSPAAAR